MVPLPDKGGVGGQIRPLMMAGTLRAQVWSMGSLLWAEPEVLRTSTSLVTLGPRVLTTVTQDPGCSWPLCPEFRGHTSLAPGKTAPLSLGPILHDLREAPGRKKAGGETARRLQNAAAQDLAQCPALIRDAPAQTPCPTSPKQHEDPNSRPAVQCSFLESPSATSECRA